MKGHNFSKYDPNQNIKSSFEKLLDILMQLLTYTSGDVAEALSWLTELDKEYKLTNDEYGMGDFIEDLKNKGYIDENRRNGEIKITPKTEQGKRNTFKPGGGDEINPETRPFQFGDTLEQIDFTESIRNAQINHGIDSFT